MAEEKTTEAPKQDPAPEPTEEPKPIEKKATEDPKPTETVKAASIETPVSQTSAAPAKSGGGSATMIIVIVIVLLILIGVGGYFGWKMVANKAINATASISVTPVAVSTQTSSLKTATASAVISATATKTVQPSASMGDYIISDSNTRVVSESELTSFSAWQLKVARNEIYARYGRPFVHKDLQCYFAKKSWYTEDSSATNPTLTTTEGKNVATIQAYEEKIGSNLASSDSGCDTNS